MAKKTNSAAQAAAAQAAPKQDTTVVPAEEVNILTPKKLQGLSQDSKVAYATLVNDRIKTRGSEYPESILNGFNMIVDAAIVDIAVGEIACGTSAMGMIIARNSDSYAAFASMAASLGVKLPDFKALPQPTTDQLAQAGLAGIDAGQAALVVIDKKNVEKKAIEKKKEEKSNEKKAAALDPTKIENIDDLKIQLKACFTQSNEEPVVRVMKAINFYNSYLTVKASKAESPEEELKKVKAMARIDLLKEITEIVGECTFAMNGLAYFLNKTTNETKSPVSAYCLYKRAIQNAKSKYPADDNFIADVVKTLIIWSCNSKKADLEARIAQSKKNIKGFDKKVNAAEIAAEKTAIRANENEIVGIDGIIACVNQPSFDLATNLIEDYDADENSSRYKIAHRVVSNIVDTYYHGTDPKDYEKDSLLSVAQQHIGIILNMFSNSLDQNALYAEANIPELVKKQETPEESKAEETTEEAKN